MASIYQGINSRVGLYISKENIYVEKADIIVSRNIQFLIFYYVYEIPNQHVTVVLTMAKKKKNRLLSQRDFITAMTTATESAFYFVT